MGITALLECPAIAVCLLFCRVRIADCRTDWTVVDRSCGRTQTKEGRQPVLIELKATQLGILIYLAMALYFLSAGAQLAGLWRTYHIFFAAGFAAAVAAWLIRWIQVGHIPMQSMFEIFLSLGMAVWPVSLACRRFLDIRDTLALTTDVLLGVVILFPAGFIFPEPPRPLPPALQSVLFGPHVAVYILAYILLAKAAFQAAGGF